MSNSDEKSKITAIIVNYNSSQDTIKLVNLLCQYKIITNVIVVDNASSTEDSSYLEEALSGITKVILLYSKENVGYGAGNNIGLKYVYNNQMSKYVLIANPDTYISEKSLLITMDSLQNNDMVALAAPKMKDLHGNYVDSAWLIPSAKEYILSALSKKYVKSIDTTIEKKGVTFTECICGALIIMDVEKCQSIGFYDEKIFLYGEETCLGIKLKNKGYESFIVNGAYYCHNHNYTQQSVTETIRSKKNTLKSRKYILENYYFLTMLERIFLKVVFFVAPGIDGLKCLTYKAIKRLKALLKK